ncbi:MAG: fused MFS/spermidine synthase [Victivallaceae bacterium]
MVKKINLYAIAFMSGFAAMGYEILAVRVLSPYYGSSIYVWGAVISVILAGLSVGYAVGGRIADRNSSMTILARLIMVPAFSIVMFPVYGYGVCKLIYSLEFDSRAGALLLATVLFLVPYIFIGALLPMLVERRASASHKIGSSAGDVYAVSTAGSITGTLFTSFFLIAWISVSKGIVVMGLVFVICWWLCWIGGRCERAGQRESLLTDKNI